MPEHDFAVLMLKVLVEVDARGGPAQHRGKRRLAGLDRLTPQILAIELEEVEGEQEYAVGRRTACRPGRRRPPRRRSGITVSAEH
jgi:hypothetical protein